MSVALHRRLSILIYGYTCTLGYSERCKRFKKVQRTVEIQQVRCMDRIVEIFVLTKFHCHGRPSTSFCRTGHFRTDFRIFRKVKKTGLRLDEFRIFQKCGGIRAAECESALALHSIRAELKTNGSCQSRRALALIRAELISMAHAGGSRTRDHPAKGQTARQWRSLKVL